MKIITILASLLMFVVLTIGIGVTDAQAQTCTNGNNVLSGRVTRDKGTRFGTVVSVPEEGIAIGAFPPNGGALVAYGVTDADGYYVINGLGVCTDYVLIYTQSFNSNTSYGVSSYTTPASILTATDFSPYTNHFKIFF